MKDRPLSGVTYLTVCSRDGVSYINPYHCAALETRMAQFKE